MESAKMSRIVRCIFVTAALFASSAAQPYDFERASANMAQDLMTCMTFYNFWRGIDLRDGKDSSDMEYSARWALRLARIYEPHPKKVEAMGELSVMIINKLVQEEGSARLAVNYAEPCKSMLEHPADRMQYWLDKK